MRLILFILLTASLIQTVHASTNTTFVAFDLETTGFSSQSDRIIEIAAVKFQNDKALSGTNWLVNPGISIPQNVIRIHGITDSMVTNQPAFKDVLPEFKAFIGNSVLLSYNAPFDVRFLKAETDRNNLPAITNRVIDVLPLARKWFPDAPSHDLQTLAGYLGIKPDASHRAHADSQTLMEVFMMGQKKAPTEILQ